MFCLSKSSVVVVWGEEGDPSEQERVAQALQLDPLQHVEVTYLDRLLLWVCVGHHSLGPPPLREAHKVQGRHKRATQIENTLQPLVRKPQASTREILLLHLVVCVCVLSVCA